MHLEEMNKLTKMYDVQDEISTEPLPTASIYTVRVSKTGPVDRMGHVSSS
jgi:hypothetical protein